MKWERVELGNLTKITSGGTPSRKKPEYYSNGDIPWVKTGDLKRREIFESSEFITELGLKSSSAKLFPKNTVLVALYGATIGACSILRISASTNQACAAILPSEKLDENYLFYFLSYFKPQLIEAGVGGAQPNISGKIIKETQIPLPPLSEQRRLAARLDKADAVRQKSRALVDVYAELGRSVFLEVFGDPVRNERGWEVVELEEISKKITDGTHQSPTFLSEGIPFLFVSNVKNNSISFQTSKYISIEEHEDLYKRTPIEIGDILVTTVGSYGNVAAVASNEKFMFQRHVGYVKPDHSIVKYEFLVSALQSDFVQNQMHRVVKGVAQKTLNLKELKKLQIPLPPLPLQTRFAAMVANIEGQRRLAERQLEAAEAMFGGVLQGTFEG
ncbi:restriction endonuclease subunit S [Phaeodactylibacter xiamenensis]|uniref:restriction endonuclease subunit S n=1 Tax=Phaeodactylibacter xiamenensis TaxID=1524460 RepID=UPI003BAA83D8